MEMEMEMEMEAHLAWLHALTDPYTQTGTTTSLLSVGVGP